MPKRGEHGNPKAPAKAKWLRLVKAETVSVDRLLRGARGYGAAVLKTGTEPKGVAQAITWLNQARWEQYAPDDTPAPAGEEGAAPAPAVNRELYASWVAKWRGGARWPKFLGPAPGEPGCRVPPDLLEPQPPDEEYPL